ncbi:hypothetical protein ABID77_004307 [Variovorax sp. PvP013]
MKRFIEGEDRKQVTMLPECLDDYIGEDNPVRVVEAFVEALDLQGLGFSGADPAATGSSAYHLAVLLKLYLYGYLHCLLLSQHQQPHKAAIVPQVGRITSAQWVSFTLAPTPSGRTGRSAIFSAAAIQFCLTLKYMFGLALRQATALSESLLKLAQFDWNVPDYSTLSRRQKTLKIAITACPNRGGLHLLIDSTGVKMLGEGAWKIRKHGADYRGQWRKVHLGVDAQTLEIRAIEVTDNAIGDAPILPQLPAQIPEDELLCSVSADGAYDTRACHEAMSHRRATGHHPNAQKRKALGREPGGSSSKE